MTINIVKKDTEKKKCSSPNCKNILDINFRYARCDDCRKNRREQERDRLDAVKINNIKKELKIQLNEELCQVDEETKLCKFRRKNNSKYCGKHINSYEHRDELIEQGIKTQRCLHRCHFDDEKNFLTLTGYISDYCSDCLMARRNADRNRNNKQPRIEYKKELEKTEHMKHTRYIWKLNSSDKLIEYWTRYRMNRRKENLKDYLEHNAYIAREWRKNNPEQYQAIVEKAKTNSQIWIYNYKYSANKRNLVYNLSEEEFIGLITQKCHYCDFKHEKYFNGIDRVDNNK